MNKGTVGVRLPRSVARSITLFQECDREECAQKTNVVKYETGAKNENRNR